MKTRPVSAVLFLLLGWAFCSSYDGKRNEAVRALHTAGYSDTIITGWAWFECDKNDTFQFKFQAVGPTGQPATGAVCSGFFKGNTIRLD